MDLDTLMELGRMYAIKVALAILIFYVGRFVVRKAASVLGKTLERQVDATVARFLTNLGYALGLTVVIIAALGQLGIQTASFVAIVGAAGLAVGLALQGSLSNFAAGVLILIFRPIKVGDFVIVGGESGVVQEISVFVTTLTSPDNKVIIVPNSMVTSGSITNFSTMPTRRVDMVIGVSYDADIGQVRQELEQLVSADERILKEPECTIAVAELADSSVNFVCRPWVNADDYWGVMFDMNENVKRRFDELGIEIPYPQMQIHSPTKETN